MVDPSSEKLYPDLDQVTENGNGVVTGADVNPDRLSGDDYMIESSDEHQVTKTSQKKRKSLLITYLLWLTCGWFGLHHLYLGRDRHAFVTWSTLGLYFGVGWFRELWRIPEYVKDANEDEEWMKELREQMKRSKSGQQSTPPVSYVRSIGAVIVADIFGYLIIGAIPNEYVSNYWIKALIAAIFAPLACAVGIHTIGNIGRHEGRIKPALIAAYITAPLYFWNINSVFWSSVAANYAFSSYSRKWRRTPDDRSRTTGLFKRLLVLFLAVLLYSSLWGSWFYFNCTLDKDGDEVKCRDAASNFLKSPFWRESATVFASLYNYVSHHGISGLWQEFVEYLDPEGEANALQVLMLNSSATQEEITAQYRKMIRVWHPDRHQDPEKRELAAETFMQIQQAYETLSQIKSRRMKQSRGDASSLFEREKSEL